MIYMDTTVISFLVIVLICVIIYNQMRTWGLGVLFLGLLFVVVSGLLYVRTSTDLFNSLAGGIVSVIGIVAFQRVGENFFSSSEE